MKNNVGQRSKGKQAMVLKDGDKGMGKKATNPFEEFETKPIIDDDPWEIWVSYKAQGFDMAEEGIVLFQNKFHIVSGINTRTSVIPLPQDVSHAYHVIWNHWRHNIDLAPTLSTMAFDPPGMAIANPSPATPPKPTN